MYEFVTIAEKIKVESLNCSIEIVSSSFGEIIKTDHSKGVVYYDQRGSVGKFYSYNGVSKEKSKRIDKEFSLSIVNFSTNKSGLLISKIIDLLSNFRSATYDINFFASRSITRSVEYNHNTKYKFYCTVWPHYVRSDGDELPKRAFKFDFEKRIDKSNWIPITLLDFMASHYHDSFDHYIICTQHQAYLNRSRVSFYERLISEGSRPPILVYQSLHNYYNSTGSFLIDGHHKLKAYENLSINPPVIEILEYCENQNEETKNELINKLRLADEVLYAEQMDDLITTNYKYESDLINLICKDVKLSKYCKCGLDIKKYPNGQIKFEGEIIDFKREGICIDYYPNGLIRNKSMYENGNVKYSLLKYHYDGQLLFRGDENGVIERYNIYGKNLLK